MLHDTSTDLFRVYEAYCVRVRNTPEDIQAKHEWGIAAMLGSACLLHLPPARWVNKSLLHPASQGKGKLARSCILL